MRLDVFDLAIKILCLHICILFNFLFIIIIVVVVVVVVTFLVCCC